jgi:DeoR/GlpR family transcriptional regulator of sugar metabolism
VLAEERRKQILDRLSRDGQVLSQDLIREFAVSEDTIRRDLKEMADAGLLKKVHGGALPTTTVPYDYGARRSLNIPAKSAIAQRATALLRDGMLIFIDGATTTAQLVEHIPQNLKATFITHSVATAAALAAIERSETILIGGRVIPELLITTGPQLIEQAKQFVPDLSIISVHGISVAGGATVESYDDAIVKSEFIRNSAETAVLAGHEKLGFMAAYKTAAVSELSYLISDADKSHLKPFADAGMTVWQV